METMMSRMSVNWVSASTLTLLLLATSCTCRELRQGSVTRPADNTLPVPRISDNTLIQTAWMHSTHQAVNLGSAEAFTALAYATITNTGFTTLSGNIGVSPGSAVTAEPYISYFAQPSASGRVIIADAATAKADATTAYTYIAGLSDNVQLLDRVNIGGETLFAGLYQTSGAIEVSGMDLTLDAQGDDTAVFIFQIAKSLQMSAGKRMILAGNARAENVFFQVAELCSFEAGSHVVGTVIASQYITAKTAATVEGRLISLVEAVNLQGNKIVFPFTKAELLGMPDADVVANLHFEADDISTFA